MAGVSYNRKNGKIECMNRVRKIINADIAFDRGIKGEGVTVAVLDTGIERHPDFNKRIKGFVDIVSGKRLPYDDCSHGTHVCGIMCGSGVSSNGKYRGIAPECKVVLVKILDRRGNGNKEDVLKGIEWVIENKDIYNIRILNISVGTIKESARRDVQLVEAVERAWDAGLVVVVAAGNMGPDPMSITVPGNSRKVITVGASDDCSRPEKKGVRQCYSGRGPTADCICKPDIVAPGSTIVACNAKRPGNKGLYCVKSGTSMSTPIVSGAIALLLSREPYLSNVEVKMRLRESARNLGSARQHQGWGELDVWRLLNTKRLDMNY